VRRHRQDCTSAIDGQVCNRLAATPRLCGSEPSSGSTDHRAFSLATPLETTVLRPMPSGRSQEAKGASAFRESDRPNDLCADDRLGDAPITRGAVTGAIASPRIHARAPASTTVRQTTPLRLMQPHREANVGAGRASALSPARPRRGRSCFGDPSAGRSSRPSASSTGRTARARWKRPRRGAPRTPTRPTCSLSRKQGCRVHAEAQARARRFASCLAGGEHDLALHEH
jgi:hypothetical protein